MYEKVHTCIDCGASFVAHCYSAQRCHDCREKHTREYQREFFKTHPEWREYNRQYLLEYNRRPDIIRKRMAEARTEEYRKKSREYKRDRRKTPEGKAAEMMARVKYENSEKGKTTRRAYAKSEAGRETNIKGIGKRRARINSVESDGWTPGEIYKRDEGICQICGLPVYDCKSAPKRLRPQYDHIVPLCAGGTNTRGNIQLTHAFCNNHKNTGNADVDYCKEIIGNELRALADSLL